MRGCLLFFVGIVLGILAFAVAETLVIKPSPLPQPAPANSDVTILFKNAFLTRELQTQLSQVQSPLVIQGPAIQGQADQTLALGGTAVAPGVPSSTPVRIILRPSVVNNKVSIQVVSAQLGSLPLPISWLQPYENQINDYINRSLTNQPYRVVGAMGTTDGLVVDVDVTR